MEPVRLTTDAEFQSLVAGDVLKFDSGYFKYFKVVGNIPGGAISLSGNCNSLENALKNTSRYDHHWNSVNKWVQNQLCCLVHRQNGEKLSNKEETEYISL